MLEQEENQKEIIDYLLKSKNYPVLHEGVPLFLFEFFIFDMVMPKEVFMLIKQPMLILRLLDFPSQTLLGTKQDNKCKISFSTGKSCFFEMEIEHYKQALKEEPLYIMLVDVNFGDMKIIASSKLNVSVFAYDQFCQFSGVPPLPRRNVLKLFDNKLNNVCEFDVSLLIRREYFKYKADQEGKLNQDEVFTKSDLKNSQVLEENINSNSKREREHEKEFLSNKPKSVVIENNAITVIERTKKIIHNKSISHTEVNSYNSQTKLKNMIDLNKSSNIANNIIDSSTNTNNLNKSKTTNNQLKNSANKKNSNQTNNKSNNYIQQMVDPASKSYANDLKEFLSGNNNTNPPPLYYYSQKQNQINAMDKRKYENKKKQEEEERIKNINVVISYENNSNTNTNNNTRYNNNKDNNFRESRESFTKSGKNTSQNYYSNKPNNNIHNSKNNNFSNNNSESDYLDAYNRNSNRIVSFINNEKLSKKESNIKERVNHTSYNEFKNQKIKQMENSNSKYFYNPNDKNYEKQMKEVNYYYTNASYKDPNNMEYLKNHHYDEIQKMWMTNMLKKLSSYMTSSTEANFTINNKEIEIKDRDKYLYINTGNTNTNINDYNIHNISAINPRQSDIFRSNDFYIASQKNQTRLSGNNQYIRDTDKFLNKNSLDENEDIEAILNAKFDGSIQQDSDNKTFSPENRKNPTLNSKYNHPFNLKNNKIENKPIMENSESHNKTNSEIVEDLVNIHTQNIVEVTKKNSKSKFSSKHDTKVSSNHNKTYNDTFNKEESIREESRIHNKFNNYDYNNDQTEKDNEIEDNDDVPSLTIESRIYNNTKHRVQVNNKTKSPQKRNQNSTYLDNYDDSEIMEDLILSTKHNISKKYTLSNNKNSNSNKKLKESEISESIDMNLIDRSNSPQPLKASNNRNLNNTNTYNNTQEILSEDSLNNKIDKAKGNEKFIHVLNRSSNKEFKLKNSSSKKVVNDSICDNYEDFDVPSEKSLRNKFGNKNNTLVKTEESQIKEEVNISSGDYYKFDVKDKTIRTNSSVVSEDDYKNKFDKNDNESKNFENEDPINQNTLSQENNKERKNNNTTINTDYIQDGIFDEEY